MILDEKLIRILTDLDRLEANLERKHLIKRVLELADLLQEIASSNESNPNLINKDKERVNLLQRLKGEYDDNNSESDDEDDNEANLPRETESLLIPGIDMP